MPAEPFLRRASIRLGGLNIVILDAVAAYTALTASQDMPAGPSKEAFRSFWWLSCVLRPTTDSEDLPMLGVWSCSLCQDLGRMSLIGY